MVLKLFAFAAVTLLVLTTLFWLWTPDKNLADLEHRYLAQGDAFVVVEGSTLHIRDGGAKDAPAVLMIHGFGSSMQTWDAWVRGLEPDHRVICIDLPGNGLSPPDATGDYTDRRSLALLTALLDHLGIARASVVGHSIGGRIAWTFAAAHPQRVDKLVLVAPDGFASPGFEYGRAPEVPAIFRLMRYALPKPVLRMNLAAAYADPAVLTDALVTRYHDLMLAPGAREAMLARMAQTVLVDPVPILARIHAPTLLMWGEGDAMIPIANSADYLKAMPDARLVTVAHSGHLPQEEAPDVSLKALRSFLQ